MDLGNDIQSVSLMLNPETLGVSDLIMEKLAQENTAGELSTFRLTFLMIVKLLVNMFTVKLGGNAALC